MDSSLLFILFGFIALSCNLSKISAKDLPPIFVFGDSLADVGNNNFVNTSTDFKANFAYNGIDLPGKTPTGRFSNGYNTIDWLAKFIGHEQSPPAYLSITNDSQMQQGVNFASGGSGILNTTDVTTLTLFNQIGSFIRVVENFTKLLGEENTTALLSKSLFLISTGSNDMFAYYLGNMLATPNAARHDQFVADLTEEFGNHVEALYALGGRKFGIIGLSQIGCIPVMRGASPTGKCAEELNNMAVLFNLGAQNKMMQLRSELPEMKYSYGNVYALMLLASQQPDLFGYKETKAACCGTGKFNGESMCALANAIICEDRTGFVFWDRYHPTEASSKNTAKALYGGSRTFTTPKNIKQLVCE